MPLRLSAIQTLIATLRRAPSLVIMDTEQTCWEGSRERRWSGPGEAREVIQIGAVRVDTQAFQEAAPFEAIVRPKLNPVLSDFCVRLTGVTQERLDREGVPFGDAYGAFQGFTQGSPVLVYYADEDVMTENVAINETGQTVPPYRRLRPLLEACGVDMAEVNSGRIARRLGSPLAFREHDALADVRSMAAGLAILAEVADGRRAVPE